MPMTLLPPAPVSAVRSLSCPPPPRGDAREGGSERHSDAEPFPFHGGLGSRFFGQNNVTPESPRSAPPRPKAQESVVVPAPRVNEPEGVTDTTPGGVMVPTRPVWPILLFAMGALVLTAALGGGPIWLFGAAMLLSALFMTGSGSNPPVVVMNVHIDSQRPPPPRTLVVQK